MTPENRDKIIDDLLKKYPRGPHGITVTYEPKERYCYTRRRYVKSYTSTPADCGYDEETLFDLNLHNIDMVKEYIRKRWFSGQTQWEIGRKIATITRRTNRVWHRLKSAVQAVQERGSRGIYNIHQRYAHPTSMGYIFACNINEALTLVKTFFPKMNTQDYTVQFIEKGDVHKLHDYNKKVQEILHQQTQELA